jgi:hypothetical protein
MRRTAAAFPRVKSASKLRSGQANILTCSRWTLTSRRGAEFAVRVAGRQRYNLSPVFGPVRTRTTPRTIFTYCKWLRTSLGDALRLPSGIRHVGGAKLNLALVRNVPVSCSDFSATFTTIAFDDSSLRWLEIST